MLCNSVCTDTQADKTNCGKCGNVCPLGASCVGGACVGPMGSCTDGVQDGTETDVDCGGGACPPCAIGLRCQADTDCATNACDALTRTCVPSQCTDHQQDGLETDVDCGGGICPPCTFGRHCKVDPDCTNGCDAQTFTCASSICVDHHQDGTETDVDCGGNFCAPCAVGQRCQIDSDCKSQACDAVALVCVASQCADRQKDGAETDIDCGGGACPSCAPGRACLANADCITGFCAAGICK
jgi:hypothetical protein